MKKRPGKDKGKNKADLVLLISGISSLRPSMTSRIGVDILPEAVRFSCMEEKQGRKALTRIGASYLKGLKDTWDITEKSEEYVGALRGLIADSRVKTKNVSVSIPVSSAIIKIVTIPLMPLSELSKVADTASFWSNYVQFSGDLDEYSFYWEIIKRDEANNEMAALFVASKHTDIGVYTDIVERAGLVAGVVDVRCFSVLNAVRLKSDTGFSEPLAFVEFGRNDSYLMIWHDETPHITDLYISDQDRAAFFSSSLSPEDSEMLFDRYSMQVKQTLSSFNDQFQGVEVKNLHITTPMPNGEEVVKYLSEKLSPLKVALFDPLGALDIDSEIKKKVEAERNISVYAAAIGLAARRYDTLGIGKTDSVLDRMNLHPQREKLRLTARTKLLSISVLILLSIILLGYGAYSYLSLTAEKSRLRSELAEHSNLSAGINTQKMILNELRSKENDYKVRIEEQARISSNHKFSYDAISQLVNMTPRSIWLKTVTYDGRNSLDVTGETLDDRSIHQLVKNLNRSEKVERAYLLSMSLRSELDKLKKQRLDIKIFKMRCVLKKPEEASSVKGGGAAK